MTATAAQRGIAAAFVIPQSLVPSRPQPIFNELILMDAAGYLIMPGLC